MERFTCRSTLPVSSEKAFAWHARPGAIDRLIPPWESVQIEDRGNGIHDGSRVILVNRIGPLRMRWIAEHLDYYPPIQFRDLQRSGPFTHWDHTHRFTAIDANTCILDDDVVYQIPAGSVGRFLGRRFVHHKLSQMFEFRHRTTVADLEAHQRLNRDRALRVAISGSHGLIGSDLVAFLTTGGHDVIRLVRPALRASSGGPGTRSPESSGDQQTTSMNVDWDPTNDRFDAGPLDGIDAMIHLGGANIADQRWNTGRQQVIRTSRTHSMRLLAEALARMATPPRVLVCASAVGIYGDRGDELLDESSAAGTGFLADVGREWEAASRPAVDAGVRVVHARFGIVLSPRGGALARMLLPFRCGVGGRIGSGRQWMSWIGLDDAIGAIHHAVFTENIVGPVNVVTPIPVTNQEFASTLGRVLSRPSVIPLPATAARLAFGEMANELLLSGTRVTPQALINGNYAFRHMDLESALRHQLGQYEST